jgi:hypothetical protein
MNQTQLNKLAVITSQFIPPGRGSTLHQGLSAMVAPGSSYWQLPATRGQQGHPERPGHPHQQGDQLLQAFHQG